MIKTKIAFLGLGGVGGYYGAQLAHFYENDSNVDIYFIARGDHLTKIKSDGIKLTTPAFSYFAHPTLATDNANEVGEVDYVILSTKSYDIASSIEQIRPMIGENSVIVPLLNGGDITERIRAILPQNEIWSGCTYVIGRKTAPGEITGYGDISKIVFGYDKGKNERVKRFYDIFKASGIDIRLVDNVRDEIWTKFFLISITASLTSYFDIMANELAKAEHVDFVTNFASEFLAVAKAEKINLPENSIDKYLSMIGNFPVGTTSSMHSDYINHHTTEVETITGVIVKLAKKHNIEVPLYNKVYTQLVKRSEEDKNR